MPFRSASAVSSSSEVAENYRNGWPDSIGMAAEMIGIRTRHRGKAHALLEKLSESATRVVVDELMGVFTRSCATWSREESLRAARKGALDYYRRENR